MKSAMDSMPNYEKLQMVLLGLICAVASFAYGVHSLLDGTCTLVGRGSPPVGTFVTFYGTEARLLSLIYIGLGVWLFGGAYLSKIYSMRIVGNRLSWLGGGLLMVGLGCLVVILCTPFF